MLLKENFSKKSIVDVHFFLLFLFQIDLVTLLYEKGILLRK